MRTHMHDSVSEHMDREDERAQSKVIAIFFIIVGIFMIYYGFKTPLMGGFLLLGGFFLIVVMVGWWIGASIRHKKNNRKYRYD